MLNRWNYFTFFSLPHSLLSAGVEGAMALKKAREKEYWEANEDPFLDRTGQLQALTKIRGEDY